MDPARELFERYLQAVRKYLPSQGQNDILNELRANLEAQIEEREEELGRSLTEGEMLDWLKQLGPPIQVAARYRPLQYLIGPALFPMYWYVMRIVLSCAAGIYGLVNAILITTQAVGGHLGTGVAPSIAGALFRLPGVLIDVAAWVTAIFAVFEFVSTRYPSSCAQIPGISAAWSPAALPPLEKPHPQRKRARSFAQAVAEVVFGYVVLVWLLLIPHYPFLLMGPGVFALNGSPYALGTVWMEFYWVVLALNVIQLTWNSVALWRGDWQQPRPVYRVVSKAFGLLACSVVLFAPGHAYLVLRHPAGDQAQFGSALEQINRGIWSGLGVLFVILAIQLLWEFSKLSASAYRMDKTSEPMNQSRQNGY